MEDSHEWKPHSQPNSSDDILGFECCRVIHLQSEHPFAIIYEVFFWIYQGLDPEQNWMSTGDIDDSFFG